MALILRPLPAIPEQVMAAAAPTVEAPAQMAATALSSCKLKDRGLAVLRRWLAVA